MCVFQFSRFFRNTLMISDENQIKSKIKNKPKWFNSVWKIFGLMLFLSVSGFAVAQPSSDMVGDLPGQSVAPNSKSQSEQSLEAFDSNASTIKVKQPLSTAKPIEATGSWQPLPPVTAPKQNTSSISEKSQPTQPKNVPPKVENFNNMATPVILDEGSALVSSTTENSQIPSPSNPASSSGGETVPSAGSQTQAVHSSFPNP